MHSLSYFMSIDSSVENSLKDLFSVAEAKSNTTITNKKTAFNHLWLQLSKQLLLAHSNLVRYKY